MNRPRKELMPSDITAVIDTREQRPVSLTPLRTVRGTLASGDYSCAGLENLIAYERKSLPDLIACVGGERKRFEKCVTRLLAYPCRGVVIEASWADLEAGGWRSAVLPAAAIGSVLAWSTRGLPVYLAGDAERAGRMLSRLLFLSAKQFWRQLGAFHSNLRIEGRKDDGDELAG